MKLNVLTPQMKDLKSILDTEKKGIEKEMKKRRQQRKILFFCGILFMVMAFFALDLILWKTQENTLNPNIYRIFFLIVGIAFLLSASLIPFKIYQAPLEDLNNKIDFLISEDLDTEERAERLFKQHNSSLKKYYDESLLQNSMLFKVGIFCVLIGLLIVGITFYLFYENIGEPLTNQLIIGSVGAISVILNDFIAYLYLKMHSESVKSLDEFHSRFVNTHHFYFGNYLISKIEDKPKMEDALVKLALALAAENKINSDSSTTDDNAAIITPSNKEEGKPKKDLKENLENINTLFELKKKGGISEKDYQDQVKLILY